MTVPLNSVNHYIEFSVKGRDKQHSSDIWLPNRYEKYKTRLQGIGDFDTMCQASFAECRLPSKSVATAAQGKKVMCTNWKRKEATCILRNQYSPHETTAFLVAPSGTAAFNVGGHIIHSIFKIPPKGPYQPLSDDTLNSTQVQLGNLKILMRSMVDQRVLSNISGHLCQIKWFRSTETATCFGNLLVLAVGDYYQPHPVWAQTFVRPMQMKAWISGMRISR